MNTKTNPLPALALAGAFASALTIAAVPTSAPAADEQERCYGVSKAGENQCAAEGNSCAGAAKTDYEPQMWQMVKKGTCTSISVTLPDGTTRNGSLEPIKG